MAVCCVHMYVFVNVPVVGASDGILVVRDL